MEKGRQCQSKEAFSGERKSTGGSVVIIEKGDSVRPPDTWLLLVIETGGRAAPPVRMLAWAPAGQLKS